MENNKLVDLTKRLIEVNKSILDIYNILIISTIMKNNRIYNEYLEYLKISVEVEKNIYKSLNLNNEEICDKFINIENDLLNNNYKYDEIEKKNIDSRIQNHILSIEYNNIYPNISKAPDIYHEANKDYTSNLICELDKEILKTRNNNLKKSLYVVKYHTIYEYSFLENKLLNNKKINSNNGRDKLINYGYDEYIVSEIYKEFITNIYSSSIDILTSLNYKNDFKNEVNTIVQKNTLKSCLNMTTIDELEDLYEKFFSIIIRSKNRNKNIFKNVELIKDIFHETLDEKYNQILLNKKNKRQ